MCTVSSQARMRHSMRLCAVRHRGAPVQHRRRCAIAAMSLLGQPLPLHQETGCIYLDYNGVGAEARVLYSGMGVPLMIHLGPQTTPIWPEVADAMRPYLVEHGNPSSAYIYGTTCKQAVERARQQVASLINCMPNEIYFTSCGTESDNCK